MCFRHVANGTPLKESASAPMGNIYGGKKTSMKLGLTTKGNCSIQIAFTVS